MVSDVGLILEGPGSLSQSFILGASSVSLAELADKVKLSRKMKLLLSYFLAKSVWQFYDSEWMQREWTKKTVHFMFERRLNTPKGIFINEPFLSACFNGHPQPQKKNAEFRSHVFPKILALGIMLLEIELNIKIEDYRVPEDIDVNCKPTVNAKHIAAMEAFNNQELWDDKDTFGVLKDVIADCLIPEKFKTFKNDVEGLRAAFDKHVVSRLHGLYRSAWEDPDTSSIRAVEISQTDVSIMRFKSESTPPPSPLPARSL